MKATPDDHLAQCSGEDLAEIQQRHRQPKRQRAKHLAARQAEKQMMLRRLGRQAQMEHWRAQAHALLRSRVTLWVVLGALAVAVAWVSYPPMRQLIDPPLSEQQLGKWRGPVDVAIAARLGAPPRQPTVRLAGDDRWFELTYLVPRGKRMFDGRRTRRACRAVVRVDRHDFSKGRLRWQLMELQRCRSRR